MVINLIKITIIAQSNFSFEILEVSYERTFCIINKMKVIQTNMMMILIMIRIGFQSQTNPNPK